MSVSAGGGSSITQSFIAEDGSILWARLTSAIFGGAWLAIATGIIDTILATAETVAGLYSSIGGFLAAVVNVLIGGPTAALSASYDQLIAYVSTMGPLAFVGSIVSVVIIARVFAWGASNVI